MEPVKFEFLHSALMQPSRASRPLPRCMELPTRLDGQSRRIHAFKSMLRAIRVLRKFTMITYLPLSSFPVAMLNTVQNCTSYINTKRVLALS